MNEQKDKLDKYVLYVIGGAVLVVLLFILLNPINAGQTLNSNAVAKQSNQAQSNQMQSNQAQVGQTQTSKSQASQNQNNHNGNNVKFESIITGTTGSGDVSIELTPIGIKNNKFIIEIATNTHSVKLDAFDLKELATLEVEGNSLKPISAPKFGGHHSTGELVFDVQKEPSTFKVTIKGIPAVENRIFEWN